MKTPLEPMRSEAVAVDAIVVDQLRVGAWCVA